MKCDQEKVYFYIYLYLIFCRWTAMDIEELNSIVRSQAGKINSLLVQLGTAAADQILLVWPASFDPFFADFPFRVVCRPTEPQQQPKEVSCCFYTFSNLFHEVRLHSRAEAENMLQLVTRLDFVACQGFPEPATSAILPLGELLIDKQSAGWIYRSRQCLYLTSKGFSICNFCAALQKKAETASETLQKPKSQVTLTEDLQVTSNMSTLSTLVDGASSKRTTKQKEYCRTSARGRPRILTYPCPADCAKVLGSRAEVGRHVRLAHADLFRCDEEGCGKSLSSKAALQLHAKRHARQFAFACGHCERGFVSQKEVNMHEKVHNSTNRLTCSLCSRQFVSRHKLKLHMTLHTGRQDT